MSERIYALAQSLLGKRSIDECNLGDIQDLVDKYPYFAPARFLLLEKLRKEDKDSYIKQLPKAILFYHNPAGFEHFLSSGRFENGSEEAPVITPLEDDIQAPPAQLEPVEVEQSSYSQASEAPVEPAEISGSEPAETEIVAEEEIGSSPVETEQDIDLTPVSAGSLNEIYPPLIEPVTGNEAENQASESTQDITKEETEEVKEGAISSGETENTPPATAISETAEKDPGEATTGFVFEPYHTVDYFASQGIKINAEDIPKDKFGKQLKSFTEWLKSMKKLPANEAPKIVDSNVETKVVSMANQSVNDSDIVTEAMAEVWLKQGNKQKALEIYNKLVLLDPSKKAFFAGKIENLKNPS